MISKQNFLAACSVLLVVLGSAWLFAAPISASAGFFQATATLVFTGSTAVVTSEDQEINLRGGPGTDYALVGKLRQGDEVPALGRSPGGDWVLISFPSAPGNVAWVYAYLVTVNGALPVAEPPATPTPLVTPTIDPTLAAQFIREIPPTRLPTFTAPPPLVIPTFRPANPVRVQGNTTMAYLIIGLAVFGALGMLTSFFRGR